MASRPGSTNIPLFILFIAFVGVSADSVLKVLQCPHSLQLSSGEPMSSAAVADFLALSIGLSSPKPFKGNAFTTIKDVLALPKASLTVHVDTRHVLNASHVFPLDQTSTSAQEFSRLAERTESAFGKEALVVGVLDEIRVLGSDSVKKSMEREIQREEDSGKTAEFLGLRDGTRFVAEMQVLTRIVSSIKTLKERPKRVVFWFEINSLSAILDANEDETAKNAAKRFFADSLDQAKRDLMEVFGDRVIVTLVEEEHVSVPLVRHIRQTDTPNATQLNLAHHYARDFHTAFATTAFTTLLIALAVYAVAVAMWNLDPGKDSIIYRMTSQRIKKDQ